MGIRVHLHRTWLPAAAALLVAMAVVPIAPGVADASTDYAAACSVHLRATPSISAATLIIIPTGAVVTAAGTVQGDPWSATCVTDVSGSTWYAIVAMNGVSVSSRFGVGVVYAATGLFQAAVPQPLVYMEGIDVSQYQQAISWPQVAGAGKRFAIMRATLGQAFLDPMYATNHAGARAVGMQVTAYHFATPSASSGDAVLEADWFVQNAALLPGDLVPALDLEQTGGLSATDLQAWVGAWLGEVYARLGVRSMIYTSPDFWTSYMGDTTMFADQGYAVLWVAHWFVPIVSVPANNWGGHNWTFWQYDDCGSVPGVTGCVDLDRYNGTDLTPVTFNYSIMPPNLPPVLTAIAPATVAAGGPQMSITLQGGNFVSGISTVYWNGAPLPTTFVSPTALTAVIPAALTQGTVAVTVVNQPPGGGASAPLQVTVTVPAAQLAVTPSTTVISWGQTVTLAVDVAGPGANRTVTLQRMQANEEQWADIATLTTDASGHATFDYRPPVNTQFQAVFAGAPDLGPGASPPARVVVRQLILLRPTNPGRVKSVPAGSRVLFTSTARPIGPTLAPAKVTFQFWRRSGGHWVFVAKRDVYVDASGRARWTWAFSARGEWYVRAIADPTQTNANSSWSPQERYSVF
jgi:GH25 family lysozyme M1 (1,4-beta-N-acetylmuramidase)